LADRQELAASADERGNYGFLPRLFDSWGYGFFNVGCPGAKAVQTLAASAMKIWQGLDELSTMNPNGKRPYNNYLQRMGRNDNNAASATWLTPIRNLNTRLRTRDPTIPSERRFPPPPPPPLKGIRPRRDSRLPRYGARLWRR
jgi:hypothetical protein